ncbi:hypothetical protein [Streptomyces sp. NRRL B-3648]|uniref:hypothetical protein n=1 Tax=Streptomyces sp. NRRL B-3648 TaxID=1519493 RepID=UPI000AB1AB3E|nr:hypothetical protein [Streptomyces sp. NRRL B-3648]
MPSSTDYTGALAAGLAVRLVPERFVLRAVPVVFGGATAVNVCAVPAGTLIGGLADWRTVFPAAGGLGLLVPAALLFLLPPVPAQQVARLRTPPQQFRLHVVRAGVLTTLLLVGGRLAAFTFVDPILQSTSGIDEGAIGPSCSASVSRASSATTSPGWPRRGTSAPPASPSAPC